MSILVINSGSSSIKFELFQQKNKQLFSILCGNVDAIGLLTSKLTTIQQGQKQIKKVKARNHFQALECIFQELGNAETIDHIDLIGHRVVHGGEKFTAPTILTDKIIRELKKISYLAPLHNPANIDCIEACAKIYPKAKQVAIFDTAFHHTLSPLAYTYAIPNNLYKKHGIRKFGFHGISHQYLAEKAKSQLRKKIFKYQKIITVHLGNGASINATLNGKSIENSMGYTPLQGLIMGSRSGDIDPALPEVLGVKMKKSPAEISVFLNNKCGLLALSESSTDMRIIWQNAQKKDPKAQFAIDKYCYHLGQYINSYIGILGGIHAIVFSGGIGEHAWYVREKTVAYLKHLGINLDKVANKKNSLFIQGRTSSCQLMVIPTHEEATIAAQSYQLIATKK